MLHTLTEHFDHADYDVSFVIDPAAYLQKGPQIESVPYKLANYGFFFHDVNYGSFHNTGEEYSKMLKTGLRLQNEYSDGTEVEVDSFKHGRKGNLYYKVYYNQELMAANEQAQMTKDQELAKVGFFDFKGKRQAHVAGQEVKEKYLSEALAARTKAGQEKHERLSTAYEKAIIDDFNRNVSDYKAKQESKQFWENFHASLSKPMTNAAQQEPTVTSDPENNLFGRSRKNFPKPTDF